MKNRKELENNLIDAIEIIKRKKRIINDIKLELGNNHDILPGEVSNWINKPNEYLQELDIRELYLLTEQILAKTEYSSLKLDDYFTSVEAKESRIYKASIKRVSIEFPITLENFSTSNGIDKFSGYIDAYTINELFENQLLVYDYNLQREPVKKKLANGEIRLEPRIIRSNLNDIKYHLEHGTLEESELWFNVELGSADSGIDIDYDPVTRNVTINSGAKLALGDGYHRCSAVRDVLRRKPEINHVFRLFLTNFTLSKAQTHLVQISKGTNINQVHIQKLASENKSDKVVSELNLNSELKGKISSTQNVNQTVNELVSFTVLSNAIEVEFDIETNFQVKSIAKYLTDFFDILMGIFSKEFITDIAQTREESLINDNNMFVAYICIAKRMQKENIPLNNLETIINSIDFSKSNPLWQQIGVLDEKQRLERNTKTMRRNIKQYFESLNLKEIMNNGIL